MDKKVPALCVRKLETRWGVFTLVASAAGVCAVGLPGESSKHFFARLGKKFPGTLFVERDSPVLKRAAAQLREYLAGKRRDFTVPFHIRVSPFQFRVLEAMSAIPYGRTATYGELARRLGRPRAARAVGAACAANPIPLLVPCHRVVGARGALTGFGGGLALKRKLLALEGVKL